MTAKKKLYRATCPNTELVVQNDSYKVSSWLHFRETVIAPLTVKFTGKTVILHGNTAHLAKWLLLLDGIAARVIPIFEMACEALITRVTEQTNAEMLVTANSSLSSKWSARLEKFEAEPLIREIKSFSGKPNHEFLEELDTEWIMTTSGTTSTPKLVVHNFESLSRSSVRSDRLAAQHWGLLYDPTRFAGMQLLLQALVGGGRLIAPAPVDSFEERIACLVDNKCTALSATPTLWRKILMVPNSHKLDLVQITLGGEIVDQSIINALNSTFPKARITHIYASTEAGVGFSVKDGLAGFPVKYLDDMPASDTELKVGNDNTLLIRKKADTQYYLNSNIELQGDDHWIDTGDLVECTDDRIYFKGRLNGSINVGGNKVSPEEVELCILEMEKVAAVSVTAKSSSLVGSLIQARVTPSSSALMAPDEQKQFIRSVREHCQKKLSGYKVPAIIRIAESIAISASGKLERS